MPKYQTNSTRTDNRQIAQWEERPFVSYDRRSDVVHHRILVDAHPGVGADIRHEVKSPEMDRPEWTPAEVYEVRQHGVDHVQASSEWWE